MTTGFEHQKLLIICSLDPRTVWLSPAGIADRYYSGTGSLYVGNVIRLAASTPYGEWIKIEMPHQLWMTHILLASDHDRTDNAPRGF